MTHWRRVCSMSLSLVLALSLVLGSFGTSTSQAATKKAKLKTKSISVTVGKTKSIKITNKKSKYNYTFTSKNKKIATVTKKGKVKGIKAGSTKITVKEVKKSNKKKKRTVGTVKVKVKKKTNNSSNTPSSAPNTTNAPAVTTAPPAQTDTPIVSSPTSLKIYMDEIKDENQIGTIEGVGFDPTPAPTAAASEATPLPTPKVIYNLSFEDGDTGVLGPRGSATVEVQDGGANGTSKSVLVSKRTASWHGAAIDVTDTVATGNSYEISYYIKHTESDARKLGVCMQYNDEDGQAQYPTIKEIEIPSGEWTKVTVTIDEIPEHNGAISIYWQPNYNYTDMMDFQLDEITISGVEKAPEEAPAVDLTYGLSKVKVGNPMMTSRLTADPWAMEYNGRIYVYGTNDSQQYENTPNDANNYAKINTLNVYSSVDMVNWTDHGQINVAGKNGAAKWAGNSWAPAVAHKTIDGKEKFFLYFANSANNIGVLTADSPVGPWTDPIGKALIDRSTEGCSTDEVPWLFDPAVLVDDDGTGYLYFGGIGDTSGKAESFIKNPQCSRVIKLGDDMVSLASAPVTIDAPYMFEDSGITKIGNKYYYSYCTNWTGSVDGKTIQRDDCPPATIGVMVSDNPMTGFKYVGSVMKNPGAYFGATGNNHHCFTEFKGTLYAFYHTKKDTIKLGTPEDYRTSYVNVLNLGDNKDFTNSDGTIADTKMTVSGVDAIGTINPFEKVEAETFSIADGVGTVSTDTVGNTALANGKIGGYIGVSNVDFGTDTAASLTMSLSDTNKTEYKDYKVTLTKKVTGKHNIYFVFEKCGILADSWQFSK